MQPALNQLVQDAPYVIVKCEVCHCVFTDIFQALSELIILTASRCLHGIIMINIITEFIMHSLYMLWLSFFPAVRYSVLQWCTVISTLISTVLTSVLV